MFGRRKQYGDSLIVAFVLIVVSGCANLRLPAIDPSGRGLLLPAPNYTTLEATGVNPVTGRPNCPLLQRFTSGGLFNSSSSGTSGVTPSYNDGPVFSSPPDVPACETPLSTVPYTTAALAPNLVNPAPLVAAVSPRVLVPGAYQDALTAAENANRGCFGQSRTPSNPQAGVTLGPRQQVAMVGTEVMMIAGVCGGDGYYRMREPLEWTLAQGSVGQFVEPGQPVVGRLGLRGALTGFLAEPVPELLSNNYAVACTSRRTQVLTRGTIPIDDDVIVQKGEAWIGVTSPIEGSTYVTVTAPDLDGWEQRTQTAVIHWVDGEWTLPPSAIVPDNQPHVLTTTVARRASGQPASGYLVRYQILDPTATFEDGTTTREVTTDGAGQASVRIVPATPAGGSARVQVDVIRPARGQVIEPLTIGQGIATVTWTSSQLGVQVRGPESVNVGDSPTYQIDVSNPGNTAATGVQLTALVPAGFEPVGTSPQANAIGGRLEWNIDSLAAGETRAVSVTYQAVQSGTVRHCATVQGSGVSAVEDCLTTRVGESDALYIEMVGPNPELTLPVGEEILYRVTVTNRSTRRLTGVDLSDRFDNGLQHERGTSPVVWGGLGDLEPGQSREVGLRFKIVAPGRHCHTLEASADNTPTATTGACITAEVRETPAPPLALGSLRLEKTGPTEMIVGQSQNFYLIIENDGNVPLTNLTITDAYDREFTPVAAEPDDAERTQDGFRWYISRLEPNEKQTLEVSCKAEYDGQRACSQAYAQAADGFQRASNELCVPILPASGARSNSPGLERDPTPDSFNVPPRDASPLPGADGRPRGASPLPNGGFGANSRLDDSTAGVAPSGEDDGFLDDDQGGLEVTIDSRTDRKQVGEQVEYFVSVRNNRDVADSDVIITLQLPRQADMVFYTNTFELKAADWSADWRRIEFPPIQTLRPGETIEFLVTMLVRSPGELTARIVAESVRTREGVANEDTFLADA